VRRHQLDLVTELDQLPRSMVCRGAGFHADETTGLFLKKRQNPGPAQLAADHDMAFIVNAVDLENVLRKINTNRDNVVHGRLLFPCGS
jgi:hypothetical protein